MVDLSFFLLASLHLQIFPQLNNQSDKVQSSIYDVDIFNRNASVFTQGSKKTKEKQKKI